MAYTNYTTPALAKRFLPNSPTSKISMGASMLSSAVMVASGDMYQSGHGIHHGLYHDTKGVI
jgi:hypothetical protein